MAPQAVRSALVITASDGANAGVREDTSGGRVAARLETLGFSVDRRVLPDEQWEPFHVNMYDHGSGVAVGDFAG